MGEDLLHPVSFVSFMQFQHRDGGFLATGKHFVSDSELARLKELPGLRWLALDGRRLTSDGLKQLRELTALERLWIADVRVPDVWMANLGHMSHLKRLFLPFMVLTDAGAENFAKLTCLETLRIEKDLTLYKRAGS
ncbi:MAG: hypothetical protein HUU20_27570 [Pirellulales bacterium]|nr:hypothetical protein [Pirellulales bacterium]